MGNYNPKFGRKIAGIDAYNGSNFDLQRLAAKIKDLSQDFNNRHYYSSRRQPSQTHQVSYYSSRQKYKKTYELELKDLVLQIGNLETEISETMNLPPNELYDSDDSDSPDSVCSFYSCYTPSRYYPDYFSDGDYDRTGDFDDFLDVDSDDERTKDRTGDFDEAGNDREAQIAKKRRFRYKSHLSLEIRNKSALRARRLSVRPRGGRFKPGNQALFGIEISLA